MKKRVLVLISVGFFSPLCSMMQRTSKFGALKPAQVCRTGAAHHFEPHLFVDYEQGKPQLCVVPMSYELETFLKEKGKFNFKRHATQEVLFFIDPSIQNDFVALVTDLSLLGIQENEDLIVAGIKKAVSPYLYSVFFFGFFCGTTAFYFVGSFDWLKKIAVFCDSIDRNLFGIERKFRSYE